MSQSEVSRREQALIEAHRFGGQDMNQLQKDRGGGGKESTGYDNPDGPSQRQRSAAGYTKPYVSRIVCEEKIVLRGVVAASGKEKNWVSIIDLYAFIEKEHKKQRKRSKGAKKKKKEMFKMGSLLNKFRYRKKKLTVWVEKNLEIRGKGRKIFMKMKTKK